MPKIEYAITQVASVSLTREEIEEMVAANLIARGADPSYDFATGRPIFVWDDKYGGVSVRWVQGAAIGDGQQWRSLHPVPTRAEIDKIMDERRAKAQKVAA